MEWERIGTHAHAQAHAHNHTHATIDSLRNWYDNFNGKPFLHNSESTQKHTNALF